MSILFNKNPLTVNVELAEIIGLNESIVLQQLHFWLKEKKNFIDNRYWVYNSIPDWQKQFKFWSESTVKRIFESLTKLGVLFIGEYNKDRRDRTKWYSINYEKLNEVVNDARGQNEPMQSINMGECIGSDCTALRAGQNDPTITKEYPKTTTKDINDHHTDHFDLFWSAGLPKINKSKAIKSFESAFKKWKSDDQLRTIEAFAEMLFSDIQLRLVNNQFGFDKLHPTTYLNNQRWNDEVAKPVVVPKPAWSEPPKNTNWADNLEEEFSNEKYC